MGNRNQESPLFRGLRFYKTASRPSSFGYDLVSFTADTEADREAFKAAGYKAGTDTNDGTVINKIFEELDKRGCTRTGPSTGESRSIKSQ